MHSAAIGARLSICLETGKHVLKMADLRCLRMLADC